MKVKCQALCEYRNEHGFCNQAEIVIDTLADGIPECTNFVVDKATVEFKQAVALLQQAQALLQQITLVIIVLMLCSMLQ